MYSDNYIHHTFPCGLETHLSLHQLGQETGTAIKLHSMFDLYSTNVAYMHMYTAISCVVKYWQFSPPLTQWQQRSTTQTACQVDTQSSGVCPVEPNFSQSERYMSVEGYVN